MIERAIDRAMLVLEGVLGLTLMFVVALNFANVVGRYILGLTFLGADEIEVYLMVAMAFLGAIVVSWRGRHLRMDVVVGALPPRPRMGLRVFELLVTVLLTSFVAVQSWGYTSRMFTLGATSDMAGVPMWLPHSAVTIGLVGIAAVALWRLVRLATSAGRSQSEPAAPPHPAGEGA
jgi:TRAP-type C4-dicarboxylate transport system permease small subunit